MYTEFEFIEQFLVKYAKKFPGARNLKDDAAVFLPKANKETVVSTDTYIAGVHGPSSLNPSDAVRRAILIAGSDLAAMAADPECIFLSINLPKINSNQFLEDIAKGIGPKKFRFSLGYTGWGKGQLDKEIENGNWLLMPSSSKLIFNTPDEKKWGKISSELGVDITNISGNTGFA